MIYPEPAPTVTFPASNRVRVETEFTLPTTFLRVLGVDNLNVGAAAEATRFDPDIVLIIDRSGSMCRDSHGLSETCPNDGIPWEPFTTIQATATEFINQIPGDPTFALVSYSTSATLDVLPTLDRGSVQAAIAGLIPGGYTDIAGSLTVAVDDILLTLGSNPKLIVLLTDGVPNRVVRPRADAYSW